jgi:hypothetical protein
MPKARFLPALAFVASACGPKSTPPVAADPPSSPEELAKQADIPLYPDAVLPDKKSNVRTDGKQTRYELIMATPDAPEKVLRFYKEALKLESHKEASSYRLLGRTPSGNYAMIDISPDGKSTKINAVSIKGDF